MSINLNEYICFNFYKGWREVTSFYKDVLGNDVSPQNVYVLELCDIKEKITMNQLSKGMDLDGSAVSTLVARMEKKGLLKRTHGTVDRRAVFVQLTKDGEALRSTFREKFGTLTEHISNKISNQDVKKLQKMVATITENRETLA